MATAWKCAKCGRPLGLVDNGELLFKEPAMPRRLETFPLTVMAECPRCGTWRTWHRVAPAHSQDAANRPAKA